jgi:hypothetical protein
MASSPIMTCFSMRSRLIQTKTPPFAQIPDAVESVEVTESTRIGGTLSATVLDTDGYPVYESFGSDALRDKGVTRSWFGATQENSGKTASGNQLWGYITRCMRYFIS